MGKFASTGVDSETRQRILEFLNTANTAVEMAGIEPAVGPIYDDPRFGKLAGYDVGTTVAQRILNKRATLPGSRFSDLSQLSDIKGFGKDKFADLLYSFGPTFYPKKETVVIEEELPPPEELPSVYEFREAEANREPGLFWCKKDGKLFSVIKPTVIFIHGNIWVVDHKVNAYCSQTDEHKTFQGWNIASYCWGGYVIVGGNYLWMDSYNWPIYSYGKGHELFQALKRMIELEKYNNTEIRFQAFSWGVHVASEAARKLCAYVKENNKNILVSVDLADPVLGLGYNENSDGVWRWDVEHIRENLKAVANTQVAGIKANKKLFTIIIPKWWGNFHFSQSVLPHILEHADVYQEGADWLDHEWTHGYYVMCEKWRYDEVKYDSNVKGYQPGKSVLGYKWIHWPGYRWYMHGPVFGTRWKWEWWQFWWGGYWVNECQWQVFDGNKSKHW